MTGWLESQGFKVNLVYPNQMVIDFTGTAGQIRQAFRTEIHHLLVKGQAHIANMSDPQIPAALAATVAGVVSLNDFRPQPGSAQAPVPLPNQTAPPTNTPCARGPGHDLQFQSTFAASISGQGQTIVLIEDTDLYTTADWYSFRSTFGLATAYPAGSLTQVQPPPTSNCTDPGYNSADVEAATDVEWASAGAPSAAIELASCADTDTNPGIFIALQNLLNASGTPPAIVSISYGQSESVLGAAFNASINSLYQQAVTEGVSVFAAAGDQGAASSDAGYQYSQSGITVSGFTSTPYNVSVGGTDFADSYENTNTTYWNSTNDTNYGSARSYVPEMPWNDSCASMLIADYLGDLPTYGASGLCNNPTAINSYGLVTIAAGGGGPSGCATGAPDLLGAVSGTCAGYGKPSWQSGFIGNPSDGVRDVPDVALFAADGIWGHFYVVCFSDPGNGGTSCSGAPNTWSGVGGTSVAAPIWAAIQALVNQAAGSRWGNPNPAYYSLAKTEYGSSGSASCSSALGNGVATSCIFYDVTPIRLLYTGTGNGGDNNVPCFGMNCYDPSDPSGNYYGVLSTSPQSLNSAWVTGLGSGYTSSPSCALSGGGGSGATCSAIKTGVVSAVTLTNGGSNYTLYPTCTLTGGGGTGASCVAYICSNNDVCLLQMTNFGSGYTSAPTCTITAALGDFGSGATCTATQASGISVSLTSGGSGYTSLPHCAISGGGGTGGTCAALAVDTSNGYQPAFSTATGWDFPTGIGTVNVANLVTSLASSALTLSTFSLTFASQNLATTSASQPAALTNNGTTSRSISTVTIAGTNAGDFAKSADTCTGANVAPHGTCTVSVTFTPSATGTRTASLNFTDTASNSPQTVSLTGTGTDLRADHHQPFPASATAGAAAQTLTINGTNFLSTSTVTYNGVAHTATFVSSTQLTITLSASDQATAGTYAVVVTNPAPGGGASNSVNFTVNNPVPTITSLSPTSATAGAAAADPDHQWDEFPLHLDGHLQRGGAHRDLCELDAVDDHPERERPGDGGNLRGGGDQSCAGRWRIELGELHRE